MTDRELMQQALDALAIFATDESDDGQMAIAAYQALLARLAQPDPEQTRSEKMREAGYTKRDTRLECDECGKKFTRQMLPVHDCQPEPVSVTDKLPKPEPVAWTVGGLITDFSRDFSAYKTKAYTRPLYTAPPQREWVGLTDEEIKDHWITCMWKIEGTALPIPEFARAIEAKLKEKNS